MHTNIYSALQFSMDLAEVRRKRLAYYSAKSKSTVGELSDPRQRALLPKLGQSAAVVVSDDEWDVASSGDEFDLSDEDDAFDAMSSDGSIYAQSSPIRPKTQNDVLAAAGELVAFFPIFSFLFLPSLLSRKIQQHWYLP